MIRNRKSRDDAMAWRVRIADLLASHSQLDEPLTDKVLQRLLGDAISLVTVKRHRAWLRRVHGEGRLRELLGTGEHAQV